MKFRFCGDLDCPDWVLSEIATLSKLTSVRMKILVNQIIGYCVQRNFNYDKVLKLAGDYADGVYDIKGAIAAVHFIITNAGKHDVDEQSLIQEIQQLGLPKENSEALGRQYREHKDVLQEALAQESYRISKLVKTDWRVDCVFGTSKLRDTDAVNSLLASTTDAAKQVTAATELGMSVHLNISYDNRITNTSTGDFETSTRELSNVAFELSPAKLDLLIYELSNVVKSLESIEG